jgi:hypothetical protein
VLTRTIVRWSSSPKADDRQGWTLVVDSEFECALDADEGGLVFPLEGEVGLGDAAMVRGRW